MSFGQRQECHTKLWNNQFSNSKILGVPVSRLMRALVYNIITWHPEIKCMWMCSLLFQCENLNVFVERTCVDFIAEQHGVNQGTHEP